MRAERNRAMRGAVALLLAGGAAAGLVACSGSAQGDGAGPSPSASSAARPVTAKEAELLALLRFRNYDAGSRAVHATLTDQGHDVGVDGYFDYTTHTGYGTVSSDGAPSDAITWDGNHVALSPGAPPAVGAGNPPTSIAGWTVAPLDPQGSAVTAVLAVVASLGDDRPENPLLLRQGGAQWLRADKIGGTPVTVFAGPTSAAAHGGSASASPSASDGEGSGLRYWVDKTGLARRVEVRLKDGWASVELGDGGGVRVQPLLPGAAAQGSSPAPAPSATGGQG